MAIYSLHHTPVGKSTQAQPYTAAAHIGYITRKRALSALQRARLPGGSPRQIANYLRECEDGDRKNARVIDKLMLALPRELNGRQRIGLIRDFAEHVTKGRAPWLAAFHEKGKDAHNPHCHLVIRDRDPKTGKRVIGTSEMGSTQRLRSQWEQFANKALRDAGRSERIDRRTLEAQGIQREPTIHEGPRSQAMDKRGARPKSRRRKLRNRPGSRNPHREVDYRSIDQGQSRPQVNRQRRASGETERDYWKAIDQDSTARELDQLRAIHNPDRAASGVVIPASGATSGRQAVGQQSGADQKARESASALTDRRRDQAGRDNHRGDGRRFGAGRNTTSAPRDRSLSHQRAKNRTIGNAAMNPPRDKASFSRRLVEDRDQDRDVQGKRPAVAPFRPKNEASVAASEKKSGTKSSLAPTAGKGSGPERGSRSFSRKLMEMSPSKVPGARGAAKPRSGRDDEIER